MPSGDKFNKECEEIVKDIAKEMDIPVGTVREVVRQQFIFVSKTINSGSLETINLRNLGAFQLSKQGRARWHRRENVRNKRKAKEEKEAIKAAGHIGRVGECNLEEPGSGKNSESEGGEMRALRTQLV